MAEQLSFEFSEPVNGNAGLLAKKRARHAAYMRAYYWRTREKWLARKRESDKLNRAVRTATERRCRQKRFALDPIGERAKEAKKMADWRRANPIKRRAAKNRRYHRNKLTAKETGVATNEEIARTLRNRLNVVVKSGARSGSAVRLLGCTIAEFRCHIERQFLRGMSWANWGRTAGQWHLDHIRPLASFDLKNADDLRIALHFTNYRPLWSQTNLKKGARAELLL